MFDKLVGEAYVLMRADGRLLKRDLQSAGKAGARTWANDFERELNAATKVTVRRFQQGIAKGMAEVDFSGFLREFGTVEGVVDGLTTRMDELASRGKVNARQYEAFADAVSQWADEEGDRLRLLDKALSDRTLRNVKTFRAEIARSVEAGDFSRMLKDLGSIESVLETVQVQLDDMVATGDSSEKAYNRATRALREWGEEAVQVRAQQEEMRRSIVQYGEVFDKTLKGQWRKFAEEVALAAQTGDFSRLRGETEKVDEFVLRLNDTLVKHRRLLGQTADDYDYVAERLAQWSVVMDETEKKAALDKMLDGVERRRHPVVQALDDVDDRVNVLAISIGRAFGKGSRNNFLNWIGSVTAGMAQLVTTVPLKLATTIGSIGTAFSDGFSAARAAGLSRFAAAGRGLASVFAGKGGIAGAIIAAGVAAVGFGKILPAIASAISMLAANAISLVGTLGVGLTGALLAIGPVAVTAVAGLGVLAAAWNSWADSDAGVKALEEQKKAFDSFFETLYPAIERFQSLWQDAFLGLGERVRPGILALSEQLESLFNERGTRRNLDAWGDAIENIMNDIARATTGFTEGLIAFFVPVLPYAERLSDAIADIAERFAAWATSAEGQNSIADFMERAWTAASAVWDLLREIGELIGTVFDVGADETGTGWIQGMADDLAEFNDYLKSGEGRAAIEGWFRDAKQFGEDVGNVIKDLGRIFGELDSPEGRKTATDILDAVKGIADLAVDVASVADRVGDLVDNVVALASPAKVLVDLFRGEAPDIKWGEALKTGDMQAEFDGLKETISTFVSETWASIEEWASGVGESISTFFSEAWTGIEEFFTTLPEDMRTWASETWAALLEGFAEGGEAVMVWLAEWLEQLATAITEFDLGEWADGVREDIEAGLGSAREAIATWVAETLASIVVWGAETWATFTAWASELPGRIGGGLESAAGAIAAWAGRTIAAIATWAQDTWQRFIEWASRVPAAVQSGLDRAGMWLAAFPGRVAAWLSSVPERLVQPFRDGWNRVNVIFDGAPGRLAAAVGRVISAIAGRLSGVWETITGPFRRAWAEVQRIVSSIGNISIPNPVGALTSRLPWNAEGNIYDRPSIVGVGEAGREAIVPLDRPLHMVNPSVRALSAIAQGKAGIGTVGGPSSSVVVQEGAVQVTTAATSPTVVGNIVLDEIADVIYAAVG